ncbi:CopG family transcriptional regulator [Lamprobacter modestohalophilus]|uniref:CopG family transcriptional regulator n=1 Tax=Lamprobacter modestohalophilus TaxID=1064514 RepID=UPI002ADEDA44|nr:CopG family transcriptional regulator [Lamprobacter modestohalophilus]MEA1051593.1 CopG family transcriptional regulator [Lamprobacter modestohalophilus]
MSAVQANIPDQLIQQAQQFVQAGWSTNLDALIVEAMRRYLDSHRELLAEQFIREDIDWGLHGQD